jgi:hypothetical protein
MDTLRTTERDGAQLELVQSRIVTDDVSGLARFYAALLCTDVVVNDYYVEIPTTGQRVALNRRRFSEQCEDTCGPPADVGVGAVILDFAANDLDEQHARLCALKVDWLMSPTLQPWGRRSMLLRDPEGHLVNVFERKDNDR